MKLNKVIRANMDNSADRTVLDEIMAANVGRCFDAREVGPSRGEMEAPLAGDEVRVKDPKDGIRTAIENKQEAKENAASHYGRKMRVKEQELGT